MITTPKVHLYNGTVYDSAEEVWFVMWLNELVKYGYVNNWSRNETPIHVTTGFELTYVKETQLKTKLKKEIKTSKILTPSEYTPDFYIQWDKRAEKIFYLDYTTPQTFMINPKGFILSDKYDMSIIEVKATFDRNNMTRLFINNQKFIWSKLQIFVNLVEIEDLFERTFMPEAAMPDFKYLKGNPKKGKVKGDWKVDYEPKTLKQFLNEQRHS